MKKLFRNLVLLFILLLINIPKVDAAWTGNATGGGSGGERGCGGCKACYGGYCHHLCNNKWFTVIGMTLVYYNGSYLETIGKPIVVGDYNGLDPNKSEWGQDVFGGWEIIHWEKIKKNLVNSDPKYGDKLKNAVLGDIPNLLNLMGTSKAQLEADIASGKYSKHMEPTGKITDTGIRIIAETYFGYVQSTCSGCGGFKSFYGTVKGIASLGKISQDKLSEIANTLKLEYPDIGFKQPDTTKPTLSAAAATDAGWGIGIFSPWASPDGGGGGDGKCDPGTSATTIKACCTKLGITLSNQKKNTDQYLKKIISNDNLRKYCPDPAPEVVIPKCTYSLSKDLPDKCTPKTKGYITDENNEWKCAFYSSNASYSEVKNHFIEKETSSNDYCTIYCRERVDFDLPTPNTTVYAGQYIVVNDSVLDPKIWPVKYSATKTCRTTKANGNIDGYINVKKFEDDMKSNEEAIKAAWDNYRKLYAKQEACDKAKFSGSGTHQDCVEYGDISYTYGGKKYTYWGCKKYETNKHNNYSGGKATYDGQTFTCDYKTSSCGCYSKPDYSAQISAAKNKYDSLIKKREDMISQINQCNYFNAKLSFEPKLSLEYEEPIYGNKFDLKVKSKKESSYSRYYTSGNAADGTGSYQGSAPTKKMNIRDCVWDHCRNVKSLTYPSTTWVESQKKTNYEYGLKDGVYLYIAKYSSRSFHKKAEAGANYLTMPYSNLPIHVSTDPGKYKFVINTTTYGTGNKFEKYVFTGNTFAGKSYKSNGKYNCEYTVSCERFLVKKDCEEFQKRCGKQYQEKSGCSAELIFRAISLDTTLYGGNEKSLAFLNQNGSFRKPGLNWNTANRVNEFIVNNRNVKGYEVYKQDPMYEITLTPSLMKTIREYNKKMNNLKVTVYEGTKSPTSGVAGYTSQEGLVCKNNGEHCLSDIIRTWGVKGCAISKGISGYTRCSGVTAW